MVNVSWDDADRTILRVDFFGDWTWDEMRVAVAKVTRMCEEVGYDVNVIGDLTYAGRLPSPFLSQLRRVIENHPSGIDLTVVAGMSDVVQIFWKILMQTYGRLVSDNRFLVVKTVPNARALIAERIDKASLSA